MTDKNKNIQDLTITDDLKPILSVLRPEDAEVLVKMREELTDTWTKKQVFRTETEMRISVLNDGRHPTAASKYWQAVREQNGMFEAIIGASFDIRLNTIERLKLEKRMKEAQEEGDELRIMELEVQLDQNVFARANLEQTARDRIRELKLWSQIKSELEDGSFDTQDVNAHQAESYRLSLQNRVKSLGPNSGPAEVINAVGPLRTIERLKTSDGKLLDFKTAKEKLLLEQQEASQEQQRIQEAQDEVTNLDPETGF